MLSKSAYLVALGLLVGCATEAEPAATTSPVTLTLWQAGLDGSEKTTVLRLAGDELIGTETVTRGEKVSTRPITASKSLLVLPRQIQHDAQGDYVTLGDTRMALAGVVRERSYFHAELALPDVRQATYTLDGEVPQFGFVAVVAIGVVFGTIVCADAVIHSMRQCEKLGGDHSWSFHGPLCSGACKLK